MSQPLVCMTLTGHTLAENVQIVRKYEKFIDVVELRVDYLDEDEQLIVRRFPSMIRLPCILTIRRDIDGGLFNGGEFARTNLFGRALAFANQDRAKNFAYVDFEEDFNIPSIQDAALAFGVKIIRSYHNMKEPVYNLKELCDRMRKTGYEIPKIAFKPRKLSDVLNLFTEGQAMKEYDHILCAMGAEGLPSRILSALSDSYLTYTSPEEMQGNVSNLGHLDPITLNNLYNFKSISEETDIYGITGWPMAKTSSPEIHNSGFKNHNLDSVFIPVRSPLVSEALNFSEKIGIKGLSVTTPHKESVLFYVNNQTPEVQQIGACNTVIRKDNKWIAYNTDAYGFKRALEEFIGVKKYKKKVAVIGAGGAAKAVCYVLKQMGAKVCIFNRSVEHARTIAEKFYFKYCSLNVDCIEKLHEYSNLIIQTTPVGMNFDAVSEEIDPIPFYSFDGTELLFDLIYKPAITPLMKRASLAGCRVCNGYKMLEYQAYEQFKLFTGIDYESN